jgi:hypothetical protein
MNNLRTREWVVQGPNEEFKRCHLTVLAHYPGNVTVQSIVPSNILLLPGLGSRNKLAASNLIKSDRDNDLKTDDGRIVSQGLYYLYISRPLFTPNQDLNAVQNKYKATLFFIYKVWTEQLYCDWLVSTYIQQQQAAQLPSNTKHL